MQKLIIILVPLFIIGCSHQADNQVDKMSALKLTSPEFTHNRNIPDKFTCNGQDINPELNIADVSESAKSLVLIMDDPDAPAGTWDHWIVFNIPPATAKINENSAPGIQGKNSWGRNDYGGPCPPSGIHRYFFKLYALDAELDLQEGATKQEIENAIKNHIIEKTELIGLYSKK